MENDAVFKHPVTRDAQVRLQPASHCGLLVQTL
jgi:hypothetical protein